MDQHECEVWVADIRIDRVPEVLLDDVERARRDAYRRVEDRSRFALGAGLLRLVAARTAGADPRAVLVDRTCAQCGQPHGRPRLPDVDLHVSVSHSGDLVGVAATRAGPVGLDIEAIAGMPDVGVLRLCLSDREPMLGSSDFYTYWCRKESVLKATGDGLGLPLSAVVVSPAYEPARLVSYAGRTTTAVLRDLVVAPGYAEAIAVLTEAHVDVAVRPASGCWADPSPRRHWTDSSACGTGGSASS
jgi:4'-phosphopantetheinyl transferase